MSEGKLQKFVRALESTSMSHLNAEALRGKLAEAEKEFEKLIFGTWDVDEEGWHPNRYAKDSWLTPTEATKWFRKYFGDKK